MVKVHFTRRIFFCKTRKAKNEYMNTVLLISGLGVVVVALHRGCLPLGLAVRIYLFHALAYVLNVKWVYIIYNPLSLD